MMRPNPHRPAQFLAALALVAALAGLFFASAWAAPAGQPAALGRTPVWATATQAAAATATQSAASTATQSAAATAAALAPRDAVLELYIPAAPDGAYTVVQWRDGYGWWFDVPGWSGDRGLNGRVIWWVLPPEQGLETFRWVVYDRRGGSVWRISRTFRLPRGGEYLVIQVP